MKRLLSIFLAAVMLLGVMPWQVFAEGEPNVTLFGQWVNESTTKEDTPKHYELTDKIGYELYNSGLLRGKAKQFLGWSDKAPVANGVLADGAKLFSPEDTIADVFGSSIPKDAKIYAVYYEINKPYGDPLPKSPFALAVPGQLATEITDRINANKVMIDESLKADDILKGTDNYSADGVIIDKYKKTDDDKTINEVVLNSELEMDWVAAMLAYKNIAGSNQILPILSRDYGERFKNNDFSTDDGKAAGYTHVDLNMDFGEDEGLVVPDQLFLEFKSYSWRPLYAFGIKEDGTKDVLNGLDDYKASVSNSDPRTKFSVNTKYKAADGKDKNYRKITIRVILRQWDPNDKNTDRGFTGERIPEYSIPKGPQGTVASEILSNMTLRVLGSADGIDNQNIVRITDARAKELADSEGKESITITGSIKGYMLSSLGTQQAGKFKFTLKSDAEIDESKANDLKLSYVYKKEEPKPNPTPDSNMAPKISFFVLPEEEEKDTRPREDHLAYIFGYVDKTVRPEGTLTRAEAAAMVTRLGKLDLSDTSKADYPDLRDKAWYLGNINAALRAGMLDTDEKGNLRPDQPVTRAEFIKMVAAIDKAGEGKAPFTDIAGHKYEKEINQVYSNKRIAGYKDGTFKPDAFLSRAEAAAFLNRVFNRVADDVAIQGFEGSIKKFTDLDIKSWCYYELVEATNSHELVRRSGKDAMDRTFEDWTRLLNQ
ncbi:S-layer homology domain-containing protein [Urinicoccus timonensis]|uniref:S-layer homology domain-containing protein n=1 Tax=Urinicoccus timonensis TaxID=2024205 RepID=UPI000C080402|nr:S-layer homology domain-containing protein [Urinicoccus timonensis]